MADEEEPQDLGNPEHVAKARTNAKLRQREIDDGLKFIMSTPQGRKWMWSHLAGCGPFQSPFGVDPYMSYFAGGKQNVGLQLIAEIHRVCPAQYAIMAKENSDG